MARDTRVRIGDLLQSRGLLTDEQIKTALAEQKKSGNKIGKVVVDLGFVTETDVLKSLASHFKYPYVDLTQFKINTDLINKLPETHSRRFRCIILSEKSEGFMLGMVDPLDLIALDELQRHLKRPVLPAFVKEDDLLAVIDSSYRKQDRIASIAGELEGELQHSDFDLAEITADTDSDATVVRLLQHILEDAVQIHASDIHIEPDEKVLRVRLRVDGELQEQVMSEKRVSSALVSRLKIMSGLDISEKRLPQDGRFNIRVSGKNIDIRLSTMPLPHGESVVMRILDQASASLSMEELGMPESIRSRFENLVNRPYGMILVTGPTGSGKTTTLYSALNTINRPEIKIITAEDPVEYRLPRINQVQINTKIGLSFALVLRTALRQDPDVILIGEMRDQETAEIGLRAAMTGHLVLSTLHTNDSISTAMRLIDMGCEPFLVASSLRAIVAQRLVKKICENCKAPYQLSGQERVWLKNINASAVNEAYYSGSGCHQCNNVGYSGRIGVYELLELDEAMLDALRMGSPANFSKAAHANKFFVPLSACALEYATKGLTSIKEVFRISASLEDRQPAANQESFTEQVPGSNLS
ncbi:MAG: MSHA biogenesis protein MshE [Gammaproteobacteria bacterium]|nr:MAG: MSHA biogenesis protein MshE [Gammaproteobacteria bacterium]